MQYQHRFWRFFRFLIIVTTGILLIIFALRPSSTQAANNFSYNVSVNYKIEPSGLAEVKETYNITNNTASQYLDSIKLSTSTDKVENLQVYYTNGGSIPFTTEKITTDDGGYKYDYIQINIDFPRNTVGRGANWGFVVQYQTPDIVENKGRAHIVYIPGVPKENREDYAVTLTVPKEFGPIHGFGELPKETTTSNNTKTYEFSKANLVEKSVQLLFGDSTTYQTNFNFPLENKSGFPKVYEVTLPPSTAAQTVYLNKLDPKPESIRIDADNNIIATYTLRSQQKVTVSTDILAEVRYINYDLARSGQLNDIPRELKATYTKTTHYWNSDNPVLRQKAKSLTEGKQNVAEMVKAINNYVVETLDYNNEKIKYNIRQGSLEAFKNPSNSVCLEYSDLTIAMLRSVGIPARMPVGYGYSGNLKQSSSVSDSLHSWVEAYIPNVGWINLDPTWGEKFNNFGISDIDHFAFAVWGASDTEPVAITESGVDINYQYENAVLGYSIAKPSVAGDAKLESSKWVILPFISVVYYSGTTPSNSATFDLSFVMQNVQGRVVQMIGSKAPSQGFLGFTLDFGQYFASPSTAELIQPSTPGALANTQVKVNFLPIFILGSGAAILIIWKVVKLRRNKPDQSKVREPGFYNNAEKPKSTKK